MSHRCLNVLLINPTFSQYTHGWPPLGLAYLGAALMEAGHSVRIFDPNPNEEAGFLIPKDFSPDLVGITATSPFRSATLKLAELIRKSVDVPIVVGGPDATGSWQTYCPHPAIEYAVIGEGEQTIVELADAIAIGRSPEGIPGLVYKSGSEAVVNPPRPLAENIDVFPMPRRDLLDMNWYGNQVIIRGTCKNSTTLMTARGCPHKCIFCDSRRTWSRRYRPHSARRVVDEINHVRETYGIRGFQLLDDTFPVSEKRTFELCALMEKEAPGIEWSCQARVGEISEELMLAMKRAGCIQMEFGVESGSQKILNFLRKGFTIDDVRHTFALCRKHRIRTYANLIIGSPYETVEDVVLTYHFYKEIQPNSCDMWTATPYPGTDLYEYCLDKRLFREEYEVSGLHHGHELGGNYFINSTLTPNQKKVLHVKFYDEIRQNWDFE